MIIDVHSHCIPAPFRGWLETNGHRVGATIVATPDGQCVQFHGGPRTGPPFSWAALSDIDARLTAMDRMGIAVQVLSGWIDLSGSELQSDFAEEYSLAHNESLAEVVNDHPGRFLALGTTPLHQPEAAVRVLRHAIDELGMAGLQLPTRVGDTHLGRQTGLDTFWAVAEELGAFLLLHPLRPLHGIDLDRHLLDNSVGRPAETSIALGGLILSGVFERYPSLVMCVVHGGGFTPFQVGRLDQSYRRARHIAGEHISRPPSAYLESIFVDTIVHDPAAIRFLIDRLGANRVLLGTDYPFPMGDEDPVTSVDATPGITEMERTAILGGTAEVLLQ